MFRQILENPIFVMERMLRTRKMREKWYRGLTDIAIVPSIIVIPLIVGFLNVSSSYGGSFTCSSALSDMRNIITAVFPVASYLLVLYVCFRATALTYSAFVLEKEKRTWESLAGTLMTPRELVLGKLFSSLIPLLVEIACFSPLLFIFCLGRQSYLTGGDANPVGCDQIAVLILALIVFALFFGLLGLFASSTSSTVMRANQKANAILVAFLTLTPLLDALCAFFSREAFRGSNGFFISSVVNPVNICTNIICRGVPWPGVQETHTLIAFIFFSGAGILLFKMLERRAAVISPE